MKTRTHAGLRGMNSSMRNRRLIVAAVLAATVAVGCSRGFRVTNFPTPTGLYSASLAEYNNKKWNNAITGFERLTLDLAARDTLLPLAHWYLANAHELRGEHILAASGFSRLAESFPDDTLADDALFQSGESYLRLWRRVDLDPQYGTLAQLQFRQLLGIYPDAPYAAQADTRLLEIDDMFAAKDYGTGVYYTKRRAYDSAILMFKSVVKDYPNTPHTRLALLRMVETYRRPQLNYKEEALETCATLRAAYPDDVEVNTTCPPPAVEPPSPPGGVTVDTSHALRSPAR